MCLVVVLMTSACILLFVYALTFYSTLELYFSNNVYNEKNQNFETFFVQDLGLAYVYIMS